MEAGPSRSRTERLTAHQARTLLFTQLDTDSENDSSDYDDDEMELFHRSRSRSPSVDRSNYDIENSTEPEGALPEGALPQPPPAKSAKIRSRSNGKGKGKGKKTVDNSGDNVVDDGVGDVGEGWSRITEGETENNFRFPRKNTAGLQADLGPTVTELNCFQTLFDEDVFDDLRTCINEYAETKRRANLPSKNPRSVLYTWTPLTRSELFRFLAVITQMGMDKKPSVRDYWSTYPPDYTSWYHELFQRERFEAIFHTMMNCAGTPDAVSKAKVEPFVDSLLLKFRAAFYPYKNLSLDEMVIGWSGRWRYKQYNSNKPKKYHIKVFGLCDSATSYVVNLLTYYGTETSYDPDHDVDGGQAKKVFQTLLAPFVKGHHLFADRYYTSWELVQYQRDEQYHFTGTLNTNRRNFPAELKTQKLQHLETRWHMKDVKGVVCVSWRDKKAMCGYFYFCFCGDDNEATAARRCHQTRPHP